MHKTANSKPQRTGLEFLWFRLGREYVLRWKLLVGWFSSGRRKIREARFYL